MNHTSGWAVEGAEHNRPHACLVWAVLCRAHAGGAALAGGTHSPTWREGSSWFPVAELQLSWWSWPRAELR